MPLISARICSAPTGAGACPGRRLSGASGWRPREAGQAGRPLVELGVVLHRARAEGIEARVDRVVELAQVDVVADHLGLVELGQRRPGSRAGRRPGAGRAHPRAGAGSCRRPGPGGDARRASTGGARRRRSSGASGQGDGRRRGAPRRARWRSVRCRRPSVTSVAHTSSAVGERRVVGLAGRPVGRPARTPRSSSRAWTARASGTRTTNSLRYGPVVEPRRARRGQRGLELGRPGGAQRRDVAQAVRAHGGEVDADAASASSAWLVQMLLAAFSRRMSCSRARSVITNARWPSRSVVIPTSRPGIWRTRASVQARMPRYGPPYWGGMPSGWPSPAAMSAPYSPGGARTARETGSMTATNRAPAACGSRPISGIGLEQAEEVGLAGDDPGDRPVRVGEQRSRAARSVVPAAGPAATSGISSTARSAAVGVGARASRGNAGGRRG